MVHLKILLLSIILSMFNSFSLSGQVSKIDSLERILKKHGSSDTMRVNLLTELAYELHTKDACRSENLTEEAMLLAQNLNDYKGRANAFWLMGLLRVRHNKDEALDYYKRALKIAEVIDYDYGVCNYWMSIGNVKKLMGCLDESLDAHSKALQIAESMQNETLIQKCKLNIARSYLSDGKYLEAAQSFQQIINVAVDLNDTLLLARAYGNLGSVNMKQGNMTKALEYYLIALNYNEKMKDKTGIITCLLNISAIKSKQKDRETVIALIDKALGLAIEEKDSMRMSLCYTSMGNFYLRADKTKALDCYKQAIDIAQRYDVTQDIVNLVNIGSIYLKQNAIDTAQTYLYNALALAESAKIKSSHAMVCLKLGSFYLSNKDYKQAFRFAQQSIDISEEIGHTATSRAAYKLLSDIFEAQGNYKEAYLTHVTFKQLHDSLYNEKNLQKMALLESEFSFSKEREELKQRKAEVQAKLDNQKSLTWLIVTIVCLLIIMIVLLFRWARLKRRVLAMEIRDINNELEINRKDIAVAQLKLVQNAERDTLTVKVLEDIEKTVEGEQRQILKNLIGNYKQEAFFSNWQEFETLFTKTNAAFWERLNQLYPNLTTNERRLCIFIKLNMTNKDIAQITFQTEEALKKSRLRLRRKLGIERSVNLLSFIQSI